MLKRTPKKGTLWLLKRLKVDQPLSDASREELLDYIGSLETSQDELHKELERFYRTMKAFVNGDEFEGMKKGTEWIAEDRWQKLTGLENSIANEIFTLLVLEAGANEADRASFTQFFSKANNSNEFRFQGALGFGGKFWTDDGRWYVNYYPEDRTDERDLIESRTNNALAQLKFEILGIK